MQIHYTHQRRLGLVRPFQQLVLLAAALCISGCASVPDSRTMLAPPAFGASDARSALGASGAAPASAVAAAGMTAAPAPAVSAAGMTSTPHRANVPLSDAALTRDALRLEVRTHEVDIARQSARNSEQNAVAARQLASDAQLATDGARLQIAVSQGETRTAQGQTRTAQGQTRTAQGQTRDAQRQTALAAHRALASQAEVRVAESRTVELQREFDLLQARKTHQGMVVTMADVLFEHHTARINAGGQKHVEKLAGFLREHPQRQARVEGFTDNVGGQDANQDLSERRAVAVRSALVALGVAGERITTRGYGEAFPLAGNATPVARQRNRRVEIVLSRDLGETVLR
jgi:outer membrane protein OmpA-like peptidoglycan-associated protein